MSQIRVAGYCFDSFRGVIGDLCYKENGDVSGLVPCTIDFIIATMKGVMHRPRIVVGKQYLFMGDEIKKEEYEAMLTDQDPNVRNSVEEVDIHGYGNEVRYYTDENIAGRIRMLLDKQQRDISRLEEEKQRKENLENKKLSKAMQRLCGWQQKTWEAFGGNLNLIIRGIDKDNKIIDELEFTFMLDGGKVNENGRVIGGKLKPYKIKEITDIEKKTLSMFGYEYLYV